MNWDQEKTIHFIKEYEARELLWNKDHELYFNVLKKEEAWREISDVIDEDVDVLKKKMDSLRGSRRREKNRIGKRKGQTDGYVSRWFAWESMLFLEDTTDIHPAIYSHLEIKTEDNPQVDRYAEQSENEALDEVLPQRSCHRRKRSISANESPTERCSGEPHCTALHDAYDVLKSLLASEKKDECGLFGDLIAEKMRGMGPQTRAIVQHEIHNLIFEHEMDQSTTDYQHSPNTRKKRFMEIPLVTTHEDNIENKSTTAITIM